MSEKERREKMYCVNWDRVLTDSRGNNKIELDAFTL